MYMVQTADHSNQPIFSGYKSPTDWPWAISLAVGEARRILSYISNVPPKAMPPKALWHSPKKCKEYIDAHLDSTASPGMLEFAESEVE